MRFGIFRVSSPLSFSFIWLRIQKITYIEQERVESQNNLDQKETMEAT